MSETTYSLFQQGRAQLQRGMAAQATVALEKAKRREPEKASIREALGIAYFRIRRWEAAEAEFRKLLELSPVNDYAHYALGRTLAEHIGQIKAPGSPSDTRADERRRIGDTLRVHPEFD